MKGITLREGTNVLVLKVVNETADWAGSVRFVDEAGKPVDGVEFRVTPGSRPVRDPHKTTELHRNSRTGHLD